MQCEIIIHIKCIIILWYLSINNLTSFYIYSKIRVIVIFGCRLMNMNKLIMLLFVLKQNNKI